MSYTCPKCQSNFTKSLAALNYKETTFSDTNGSFSGSAIGTGGIMCGGGTYSSHSINQTKRAAKFDEPEKANSNAGIFILFGLFSLMAFSLIGGALNDPAGQLANLFSIPVGHNDSISPLNELINLKDRYSHFLGLFFVTSGVILLLLYFRQAENADKQTAEYNNTIVPQLQDRYAQLHYCERCHTLFDNKERHQPANKKGFETMMSFEAN